MWLSTASSPYYPPWSFVPLSVIAVSYTLVQHAWVAVSSRLPPFSRSLLTPNNNPTADWLVLPPQPERHRANRLQKNQVAIVTGSNTGIGYETARTLVVDYGMTVILACRSRDKAERAARQINQEAATRQVMEREQNEPLNSHNENDKDNKNRSNHNQNGMTTTTGKAIFVHPLDLSSFESVREFAQQVKQRYSKIHFLVNNAGRNTSGESLEKSVSFLGDNQTNNNNLSLDLLFQSNFLGHYLLTAELMPVLATPTTVVPSKDKEEEAGDNCPAKKKDAEDDEGEARIINLSSVMHHYCGGGHDLTSVKFWKHCALYQQPPHETYSLSKLAAILFTLELNRRYFHNNNNNNREDDATTTTTTSTTASSNQRIRSLAVNPGAVNSDIWRTFPRWIQRLQSLIFLTNAQGCETTVAAVVTSPLPPQAVYLQPYPLTVGPWDTILQPMTSATATAAFPPLEMLGPFVGGARITTPRLPKQQQEQGDAGRLEAAAALWQACQEITGAQWS
ncbi:hypothetical protein ACA910_014952 [Epithemia clementina (nom. ined.)]